MDKGFMNDVLCQMMPHLSTDQMKNLDTTLHYAMVKQSNVKNAHRKYIG